MPSSKLPLKYPPLKISIPSNYYQTKSTPLNNSMQSESNFLEKNNSDDASLGNIGIVTVPHTTKHALSSFTKKKSPPRVEIKESYSQRKSSHPQNLSTLFANEPYSAPMDLSSNYDIFKSTASRKFGQTTHGSPNGNNQGIGFPTDPTGQSSNSKSTKGKALLTTQHQFGLHPSSTSLLSPRNLPPLDDFGLSGKLMYAKHVEIDSFLLKRKASNPIFSVNSRRDNDSSRGSGKGVDGKGKSERVGNGPLQPSKCDSSDVLKDNKSVNMSERLLKDLVGEEEDYILPSTIEEVCIRVTQPNRDRPQIDTRCLFLEDFMKIPYEDKKNISPERRDNLITAARDKMASFDREEYLMKINKVGKPKIAVGRGSVQYLIRWYNSMAGRVERTGGEGILDQYRLIDYAFGEIIHLLSLQCKDQGKAVQELYCALVDRVNDMLGKDIVNLSTRVCQSIQYGQCTHARIQKSREDVQRYNRQTGGPEAPSAGDHR